MQRRNHTNTSVLQHSIILILLLLVSASCRTVSAQGDDPLVLAENGTTKYSIVVGAEAVEAELLAAKELAHFLNLISRADFPIKKDGEAATDFEIVLGNTNRLSMEQVPASLKTDIWEGFSIVRRGPKLHILGNIPRATLYGVFDLLDVEMGVRFLTNDVTHIPPQHTLKVDVASRTYGPVIEQRIIWEAALAPNAIRNRLNGHAFNIVHEKVLGGVKFLGRPIHTFNSFVPVEKYFDTNPEYFSLINGKRERFRTQLCLTNPDVYRLSIEKIREWVAAGQTNPHNKYIVNVTPNDWDNHCECEPCTALNEKAGTPVIGALMWFVNRVAKEVAKDGSNIAIETLAYAQYERAPKVGPLEPNVIVKFAPIQMDYGRPMDYPHSFKNRQAYANMKDWSGICKNIYVWNYYTNFRDFMRPYPNLWALDRTFKVQVELGMRGLFAQCQQSVNTEMQAMRCYLLTRLMWRPSLDGREVIEEFCRLYYGVEAGNEVLRYIDYLHETHLTTREVLTIASGFNATDSFIENADAILAEAEATAETPAHKQCVATVRLPIWRLQLEAAMGKTGTIVKMPLRWHYKVDPDDIGNDEGWGATASISNWPMMTIDEINTGVQEWRREVAWYGTTFDVPDAGNGPQALYLRSVVGETDIFMDGVKIGENRIGHHVMKQLGYYVKLPEPLGAGEHTIIVRVKTEIHRPIMWSQVSLVDMSAPISPTLRTAGRRFIDVARAAGVTHINESYGGPNAQTDKIYYPAIETFLTRPDAKR